MSRPHRRIVLHCVAPLLSLFLIAFESSPDFYTSVCGCNYYTAHSIEVTEVNGLRDRNSPLPSRKKTVLF